MGGKNKTGFSEPQKWVEKIKQGFLNFRNGWKK